MRCFKCHAVEKLHDDEGLPVVLADLVNRTDVRVIQRGGSLCFALEPAESLRILCHAVGQELERDETAKIGILRFVDNAHSAAPKLFKDVVMGNDLVDHKWRR